MTPLQRAVARLVGLYAVWAGVNLLERVAYRAGVLDTARAVVDDEDRNRHRPLDNPRPDQEPWWCEVCVGPCRAADWHEDQDDEELEPADCSDVVAAHLDCCLVVVNLDAGTPA